MDERAIPVIVLAFNFLLGLFVFFFSGGGGISPIITIWIIVTGFCEILVAYMAYENAKKIDSIEEYLWKKLSELEQKVKLNRNFMEDLKKQMDKN